MPQEFSSLLQDANKVHALSTKLKYPECLTVEQIKAAMLTIVMSLIKLLNMFHDI